MSETTYYQKNRGVILNRVRRYYHDNIELLGEKARTNIENYLMKKIIEKENMEEIDIIGSLQKQDKRVKKIFYFS